VHCGWDGVGTGEQKVNLPRAALPAGAGAPLTACHHETFSSSSIAAVQKNVISTNTTVGSGTGGRCCVCAGQTLRVHAPDGSTFLREMTSWPLS